VPEIQKNLDQWEVEVLIPRETLWELSDRWQSIEVEPLSPPYQGKHQLLTTFHDAHGTREVEVTVLVNRRPDGVVMARYLKRGDVIREDDVIIAPVDSSQQNATVIRHLEDVIGQTVTRDVEPGLPLNDGMVREPILVTRRRSVSVIARRGGIVVRTPGVALSDGARNDVVMVELLDNKNVRIPARVIAAGQVEVMTGTAQLASYDEPVHRNTKSRTSGVR
jgi:flagella basal body P-ring formation protein FlgA